MWRGLLPNLRVVPAAPLCRPQRAEANEFAGLTEWDKFAKVEYFRCGSGQAPSVAVCGWLAAGGGGVASGGRRRTLRHACMHRLIRHITHIGIGIAICLGAPIRAA